MIFTKNTRLRMLLSPTLITGLLASALVMLPIAPASAQNATCTFTSGAGTVESPFQVATAADLAMVRDCHGSASNLYFRQSANFDLSAVSNWVPIGNSAIPFNDNYDGDLYVISNLKINATATSNSHFGLFGKVVDNSDFGKIEKILLDGVDIRVNAASYEVFVGGLLGESERLGPLRVLRVQGSILVTGSAGAASAAGGIFGKVIVNRDVGTTNFEGSLISSTAFTGGIAGHAIRQQGVSTTLNSSSVTGSVSGQTVTGALFGLATSAFSSDDFPVDSFLTVANTFISAKVISGYADERSNRFIGQHDGFQVIPDHIMQVYEQGFFLQNVPTMTTGITQAERSPLLNVSWQRGNFPIISTSYNLRTDLPDLFLRCPTLNSGLPIQKEFFFRQFNSPGAGPCDLNVSGEGSLKWFQDDRSVPVFSVSPPVGFFAPGNTEIEIVHDPSGLFSVTPRFLGNQASLTTASELPAGSYDLELSLSRPDVYLDTGLIFLFTVEACSYQGSGTSEDPYRVNNSEQLSGIAACSGGPQSHFKLTTNLDLGTIADWTPIGSTSLPFVGVFDGGGHTITGLSIDGNLHTEPLGLFSVTSRAKIQNLSITHAEVLQNPDTLEPSAILVGDSLATVEVHNVKISESEVVGSRNLGILLGDADSRAIAISRVEITHSKISTPGGNLSDVEKIGLLGGKFDEDSVISDTHVSESSIELSTTGDVSNVAGFMVGCDEEMLVRDSSVTGVDITIRALRDVSHVAGFAAGTNYLDHSCVFVDTVAETHIDIVSGALGSISYVGGFANDVEEAVFLRVSSTSIMDLSADGLISDVGGFIGEFGSSYHLMTSKVESHATIRIASGLTGEDFAVESIGLFIGSGARFAVSDVLVAGSIEIQVEAGEEALHVSNFIGHINDESEARHRSLSNVLINAEPILVSDNAVTPAVIPLASRSYLIGGPTRQETPTILFTSSRGVFWNSTSAPLYATDEYGTAASASEINSQAFLTEAGFNFNRDWCMIEGKPRVEAVNAGCLGSSSTPGVTTIGGGAGSASFQGPVVTSAPAQATAGQTISLVGERLDSVTAASINGIEAQVRVNNDGSLTVTIPEALTTGTFDIKLVSSLGSVTIKAAVTISASAPALASGNGWTKSQSDGTVKVYAKDVVGLGKVRFLQNGKEIAWIRAVDETDPKLRTVTTGPMSGTNYLVRTVTLLPGKNALEIFVDGVRVWRAAYTLR